MPEHDFVVEALTYPELDQAVSGSKLDFVLTNSGHYVLLKRLRGLSSPLATLIVEENGQQTSLFGGVIFSLAGKAHPDTLSDIKGKTIAITGKGSLGGYQMQAYELSRAGIHLPQDARLLATGMPQDNVIEAVLSGRAEFGFVRTGVLEDMAREGRLDINKIEVINPQKLPGFAMQSSTRLYPEWPFSAMPHIDENLARRVAAALFVLEDDKTVTHAIGVHGFAVPADYSSVEDLLRELRMPPFEAAPPFTLKDVWLKYRGQTLAVLFAIGLILLLGIRLLATNRSLKREKIKLQESESRFRIMADHAPVLIWIAGTDKAYFWFNRVWLNFTGRSLAQESGDGWLEGVHPDDIQRCRDAFATAFEARDEFTLSFRLRRFDGEYRWLANHGVPRFENQNSFLGYIGSCVDITDRKLAEAKLVKSELHLRTIIENEPECIKIIDEQGRLIQMNPAGLAMVEADSPEQVVGCPILKLIAPESRMLFEKLHKRVIAGESVQMKYEVMGLKGGRRWLETHAVPMLDNGITVHLGVSRDITENKRAEEQLKLAASVFSHAREGIMITDIDGAIIDVNQSFSDITGYSRDEVMGHNPRILSSGRQGVEYYSQMWHNLLGKGHWYGEIWNRRKSGEVYAEMLAISAVRDEQGAPRHYVALFSDITAHKEHEKQLEHIAHYDALTGLPNRLLLADRLHQAMMQAQRREQRLAVAYIDLDGFKAVNDKHGHEAGDQLLMAVAAKMRLAMREGDTLARLGGDEFVAVLLDLVDSESTAQMLNRLLNAAALPVHVNGVALQVSASLGVTFYPQPEEMDADQLLRQADQAMYQAKVAGKSRYYVFDPEQDRSVRGHHESLEHIRHALNAREFVLYYQPKVNMRTGAVIGAEALIRWQHPEKGLLPPAVFLPVIEEHSLAVEIGEWVIDTALTQMERWHAAGLEIPVSVNVSARQLQQADFVERLSCILGEHPQIQPSFLELEVLETSALEDVTRISQVIQPCREIGVMFALDDFGTGYSSLTYLKRLPVGTLKIDQSFVRDMLDDPDDMAILEGVLGLASAFRREVIAEGVETTEHGAMLLQLGCTLAQGYGIARPMPADRLPDWAAVWRPDPSWEKLLPVSRENLPLLFAGVEHRAWISAMESHLKGERDSPPPLVHNQCRFGQWLIAEGMMRHGAQPEFKAIEPLHMQVHALATKMSQLQAAGQNQLALALLDELHNLRDTLLERLKLLAQQE
jgi:diguanylate cyclase (GGDEF)-like protein/PAS domain S-box-containing protein